MIIDFNFGNQAGPILSKSGVLTSGQIEKFSREGDDLYSIYELLYKNSSEVDRNNFYMSSLHFGVPQFPIPRLNDEQVRQIATDIKSNFSKAYEFINYGYFEAFDARISIFPCDSKASDSKYLKVYWAEPIFFADIYDACGEIFKDRGKYMITSADALLSRNIEIKEAEDVKIDDFLPQVDISPIAHIEANFAQQKFNAIYQISRSNTVSSFIVTADKLDDITKEDKTTLKEIIRNRVVSKNQIIITQSIKIKDGCIGESIPPLQWKDDKSFAKALSDNEKSQCIFNGDFINYMFECLDQGGSDVHFDPSASDYLCNVRTRINGHLLMYDPMTFPEYTRMLTNIDPDLTDITKPKDLDFSFTYKSRRIKCRIAAAPLKSASRLPSIVVRLLDPHNLPDSIEEFKWPQETNNTWKGALEKSFGMIVCTGPTGSGKTTTLYAALNMLNKPSNKILTIEDPAEYELNGVISYEVDVDGGATFASYLKSAMRQDPDIIMLGEIRDEEVANTAFNAAITGHLVLTTIHADDALGAIMRLKELGLSLSEISSSVTLISAQRLLKLECQVCSGEGCENCRFSGVSGRRSATEVLDVSEKGFSMLLHDPSTSYNDLHFHMRENMGVKSLRKSAEAINEEVKVVPEDVLGMPD